jgi:hypothetical protein
MADVDDIKKLLGEYRACMKYWDEAKKKRMADAIPVALAEQWLHELCTASDRCGLGRLPRQ